MHLQRREGESGRIFLFLGFCAVQPRVYCAVSGGNFAQCAVIACDLMRLAVEGVLKLDGRQIVMRKLARLEEIAGEDG